MSDRGLCIAAGDNTLDLYQRLTEARLPGVAEVVPADGSLLVVLEPGLPVSRGLLQQIQVLLDKPGAAIAATAGEHCLAVRFDGEDLPEVARRAGCAVDGLVDLLCSLTLQVKFLGFQPGFAYLDGLPPVLHLPRRANPRKKVPVGSVALGGGYCGIYPSDGPGGWHLVGTTEVRLFDPAAAPPARLQPGDTVRLVAA